MSFISKPLSFAAKPVVKLGFKVAKPIVKLALKAVKVLGKSITPTLPDGYKVLFPIDFSGVLEVLFSKLAKKISQKIFEAIKAFDDAPDINICYINFNLSFLDEDAKWSIKITT